MKIIIYCLAFSLLIIGFIACECDDPTDPSCPNYDPCWDVEREETSADFTIYDCVNCNLLGGPDSIMMISDTVGSPRAKFVANENLDTYEWKVGTDPRTFTGQTLELSFGTFEGSVDVTLIGSRKFSHDCFPNEDGRDTVTKSFYKMFFKNTPIWGQYTGYDEDEPDSLYTIDIAVNTSLRITNFPRGCKISEEFGISLLPGYTSFIIQEPNVDVCGLPIGRGYLQKDGKTLIINYSVIEDGERVDKKFIGQKIE